MEAMAISGCGLWRSACTPRSPGLLLDFRRAVGGQKDDLGLRRALMGEAGDFQPGNVGASPQTQIREDDVIPVLRDQGLRMRLFVRCIDRKVVAGEE